MDKKLKRQSILDSLEQMQKNNNEQIALLKDKCSIREYEHLTRSCEYGTIWTEAFQTALKEHEIVEIPTAKEPYYIDDTIIVPSNRRIIAWCATIKLVPECEVLLLRNEHVKDGTHMPFDDTDHDSNISIWGGNWEEGRGCRAGYGLSGRYARKETGDTGFYGVSTCMLFNNMEQLTLQNVTFHHASGFAAQMGNVKNAVFENIWFKDCHVDGLHFGGNSENIIARHVYGEVGDDIVALNAYDWQNSSVTFGPIKNVLCEDVNLAPMGHYKAVRMEPGTYTYADGSKVDCALIDIIIRRVQGIKCFKLYFQTPAYALGTEPERGEVGSADNIFFEDLTVDLTGPIDAFNAYCIGDPVRGNFAAFEIGANTGYVSFENINLKLYKEKYPCSYLVCVGPKAIICGGKEIFDPYISSTTDTIALKNIIVNGEPCLNADMLVKAVAFDDINKDGCSTGAGKINNILIS